MKKTSKIIIICVLLVCIGCLCFVLLSLDKQEDKLPDNQKNDEIIIDVDEQYDDEQVDVEHHEETNNEDINESVIIENENEVIEEVYVENENVVIEVDELEVYEDLLPCFDCD